MKKYLMMMVLLFILTAVVAGCGGGDEPVDEIINVAQDTTAPTETEATTAEPETEPATTTTVPEETTTEAEEIDLTGLAINPLTGLYIPEEIAERRPIGIMINNHKAALPQSGLAQADVIYETLVEGGIARLFAVYKDFDAEKIGPVRSARHYYLDFAFDFDALYVHYGQSPQARAAFKELNAPNMNGLSYLDTIMCFQDSSRKRPHSTYTSYERLMKAWKAVKYREVYNEGFVNKFSFTDVVHALQSAEVAGKVTLDYSYYHYAWFDYDAETGKYMRNQFGGPHIDVETGEQLAFDNIIVQLVDMWKIKGDTEGRMDMALSTEGTGYYISQGKYIPITWKKDGHNDPTQYYTEEGNILEMTIGKTWISVFPTYRPEGLIIE